MKPLDMVFFATTVVVWGMGWTATHYQVGVVAPEVSVVWRYALTTPMMVALALSRGESLRFRPVDHLYFAGLGLTTFSMNYVLFYYAAVHVSTGLLSILFTLAAVGNVVMGAVFFGARIRARTVAGGLLGVAGVAAMFYPEVKDMRLNGGALLGFLLGLIATSFFCFGNMISLAAQRRRLPVFASLAWAMAYGTVFVAILAVAKGEVFAVDLRPPYLVSLAYLSVVGSFIGFGIYFTMLGRIGAARAGYSTVLNPVIALAGSTFLEGYRWTPLAVAGLVSVIVGVVLVLRQRAA